jgi:hypothetical protein
MAHLIALVKEFVDAVFTSCCDSIVIATGISWSCHCCRVRVHACMLAQRVLRPREQAHALRLNPDQPQISSSPLAMCFTKVVAGQTVHRPLSLVLSCLVLSLSFVLPSIPWLDISCTKISSATIRELTRPRSCVQQKETPASGAISGIACMYCEYVVVVNNGRVFFAYEPVCTCVM